MPCFPKAGSFDSRITSFYALQTDRTVDIAWGIYQPQLEWRSDMAESAVRKIVDLGTEIPNWDSGKKAVVSVVGDCVGAARRAVKRGRFAAEDLMNEAAHSVKQRPLQTVVLTFGLAFGAGALFGWMASNNHKK